MTGLTTASVTLNSLGEEVEDVTEETFFLFSQDLPSNNLGFVDEKAISITVEIAGHDFEIRQSSGLLTSNRSGGTTGAILWKITPLIAAWLADKHNVLWTNGILSETTTAVELGCGVAGLIGLALAPTVSHYILTDQEYVMKLLRENISSNLNQITPKVNGKRAKSSKSVHNDASTRLEAITFDWEENTAQCLCDVLSTDERVDLVLLCDCIYNDFLIRPLAEVCTEICTLNREKPAILLIAQQLRSDEVFHLWMETLLSTFRIWRLSDKSLPKNLESSSGYAVHIAVPRLKAMT